MRQGKLQKIMECREAGKFFPDSTAKCEKGGAPAVRAPITFNREYS